MRFRVTRTITTIKRYKARNGPLREYRPDVPSPRELRTTVEIFYETDISDTTPKVYDSIFHTLVLSRSLEPFEGISVSDPNIAQ